MKMADATMIRRDTVASPTKFDLDKEKRGILNPIADAVTKKQ